MENPTILELIYTVHRRLAEMENSPRDFGTGESLFPGEIHAVAAVAAREGCNLTELAELLEVSPPAAFKAAGRMTKAGYLEKRHREGNAKEVVFFLTPKGRRAAAGHQAFRRRAFGGLEALEAALPEPDRAVITNFLASLLRQDETKESV